MLYMPMKYSINEEGNLRGADFIKIDINTEEELYSSIRKELNSDNVDVLYMTLKEKEYQLWYDVDGTKKYGWGRRVSRPLYNKNNEIVDFISGDIIFFRIHRDKMKNAVLGDIRTKYEIMDLIQNIEKEAAIAMDFLTAAIKNVKDNSII